MILPRISSLKDCMKSEIKYAEVSLIFQIEDTYKKIPKLDMDILEILQ